jgi:hypothetical protein
MGLENRPLILRSNRFLGSALLERDLISNDDLEAANEKLLEAIQAGDLRNASLLNVLLLDLKTLDENVLLEYQLEHENVGAIDLEPFDLSDMAQQPLELDLCQATYTVPFDRVETVTLVATSYYLSKPAVDYWTQQLGGNILWYVSGVSSILSAISSLRDLKTASTLKQEAAADTPKAG